MTANVVKSLWEWRSFVWAGVAGSLVAWAWFWLRVGGPSVLMLVFAIASVLFAYKGVAGMRAALVGLMVAAFTMFLASLYWMYALFLLGSQNVNAWDVITLTVFPMVAAIVLLLGAATGFRHTTKATTTTTTA
jgi:hypothetical protein